MEKDEYEANGTVPQQGGIRLYSLHAKDEVDDALIAQEIGARPFRLVMGFNAEEVPRSLRDQRASMNPRRQGLYPLIEWGWGRQRCEAFLYERFGVRWEKSYCTVCCFPISIGAMATHGDRMRAHPDIAGPALRLEYTSVSLNPKAKLFGRHSLLEKFDPSRPADRPVRAAFEEELACPWALSDAAARCPGGGRPALRAGAGMGPPARGRPSGRGGTDGHRPVPGPGQAGAARRTGVGRAPSVPVVTRSGCRRD